MKKSWALVCFLVLGTFLAGLLISNPSLLNPLPARGLSSVSSFPPKPPIASVRKDSSLKFQLAVGPGAKQLALSNDENPIGPGLLKKSSGGYWISDTFNDRLLKINEAGEPSGSIAFNKDAFIQAFAETEHGEIWVLRKESGHLYLDIFSSSGHPIKSVRVQINDAEFSNFAGSFRSFMSRDTLFVAISSRVFQIFEDGQSLERPGIPSESETKRYLRVQSDAHRNYFVETVSAESKVLSRFKADANFDSLKTIFSVKDGRVFLEFENVSLSSVEDNESKLQVIVQSYSASGHYMDQKIFEKNSEVEIDQEIDIDPDGHLLRLSFQNRRFSLNEVQF